MTKPAQNTKPIRTWAEIEKLQIRWYQLRKQGMQLTEIGKMYDRNHSTIYQGVRKIQNLIDVGDKKILETLETLTAMPSEPN